MLELIALKPDFRAMNDTDASQTSPEDAFEAGRERLQRAIDGVQARIKALQSRAEIAEGEANASRDSDEDRARLAEQLDAARARESALGEAAEDASRSLDEAIEELRRTLGQDEESA
ncbi:hypothetical protein GCM10011367_20700 [Marinicauda pacifica]|nr:hypothetical protein GCM10011367_20700 [Marinicauda pacifica]